MDNTKIHKYTVNFGYIKNNTMIQFHKFEQLQNFNWIF